MTIPNDWGVPDWRDPEAYPKPTGSGRMLVWAWEFLRRNPEYRQFWTEKGVRCIEYEADGRYISESDDASRAIKEAEERFGIVICPADPNLSERPIFRTTAIRPIIRASDGLPVEITIEPNEIGYRFDLTLPLEGQFQRALKDAKLRQEGRVKRGQLEFRPAREIKGKYSLYLRIIDAEDAGIDRSIIAEALFPDIEDTYPDRLRAKTLQNHITAAMHIRNSGYRLLAALAIAPSKTK